MDLRKLTGGIGNRSELLVLFMSLVLFCLVLGVMGCGSGSKTEEVKSELPVPVELLIIEQGNIQETFSYTGSIEAWKELDVVPDVGGKIARIYVDIGDRVEKGKILAELDRETFELRLNQAEAAIAVANSSLKDAEKNYERAADLQKKGSMAMQQFEKIQLAYEAAKAQNQQAEAALALAEWQMDVSVMRAPFRGVITGRYLNEGDMINPQMPGAPGVVSLMDLSKVKIRIGVSELEVTMIQKNQPVLVSLDVYPDRKFHGSVYAVNAAANPLTRTFEVQVAIPNKESLLKGGMFVRVDVVTQEKVGVIVIPYDAVLGTQSDRYVFIVEDNRAVKRPITQGIIQNDRVEVLRGLNAEERLVILGQQMLHNGSEVRIGGGE
jgi:RND family efflux transporter MFP subunit